MVRETNCGTFGPNNAIGVSHHMEDYLSPLTALSSASKELSTEFIANMATPPPVMHIISPSHLGTSPL